MNANQQALITSYSDQLSSRFYSNSMALEVLISLLLILVLIVEVVKLVKKTYEWENEHETNLEMKYADESRSISNEPIDNQNDHKKDRMVGDKGTVIRDRLKKEEYIPPIIRVEEIIKNRLPQLAIIAVNIVMMSSYEFMSISAYISVVLIVISEILGLKQA